MSTPRLELTPEGADRLEELRSNFTGNEFTPRPLEHVVLEMVDSTGSVDDILLFDEKGVRREVGRAIERGYVTQLERFDEI